MDSSHCRDGLARALYDAVFGYLVERLNAPISGGGDDDDDGNENGDEAGGGGDCSRGGNAGEESESGSESGSDGEANPVTPLRFKHDVVDQVRSVATRQSCPQRIAPSLSPPPLHATAQLTTSGRVKRLLDPAGASASADRSLTPPHPRLARRLSRGLGRADMAPDDSSESDPEVTRSGGAGHLAPGPTVGAGAAASPQGWS